MKRFATLLLVVAVLASFVAGCAAPPPPQLWGGGTYTIACFSHLPPFYPFQEPV
ncbi:MAG: hypothetical protein ISS50_03965 [Anaerolineae bacterium]|nr:hypothetical protein [Anaerolineae bacterium]